MDYNSLLKSVQQSVDNSIYLIYGQDQYLIDEIVKKIKKSFDQLMLGINYILIDETNLEELIDDIESPAFGFDKKLIIVKNSSLFKKDGRKKAGSPIQEKIAEYILENKEIIDESVVLLFIETDASKTVVYEAIEKNGIVAEIKDLSPQELVSKLKNICNMYKVNCSNQDLDYLIQVSGTKMSVLINEIRKLIEYAGANGTITRDDIDNLAIKNVESAIYEITNNLSKNNVKGALEILDNLIYQKEPLVVILSVLYKHYKKLLLCSRAIKENKDIVKTLELRPNQTFLVKSYKEQVDKLGEENILRLLNDLIELDYKSKNGLIDLELGIRSVLCNYC